MGLKFTYTLIAPFYDLVARRAFAKARRVSLEQLPRHGHSDILILDKFLKPGDRAPLRRLLSPLAAAVATRTDVVFEEVLAQTAGLEVRLDQPALAGGWFRQIRLKKN